jgi:hypothetical protein
MATKAKPATDENKAVARKSINISELVDLGSFEQALDFLQSEGIAIRNVTEVEDFLGDGFTYVQKNALVNIPFVMLHVQRTMSPSYDVPMTTVRGMTATNKRIKFTDFSSGIHDQITNYETRSGMSAAGLVVSNGLSASEYDACESCGRSVPRCDCDGETKRIKATTYYLSLE